jgi:polyribonucleotide nucleotidyltransferase
MVEALQFAHEEIKKHCKIQKELTIAGRKRKEKRILPRKIRSCACMTK